MDNHHFVEGIDHGPGLPPRCLYRESLFTEVCLRYKESGIHKMPKCTRCKDVGIVQEQMIGIDTFSGEVGAKLAARATWCRKCDKGQEWKELLDT